MFSVKNSVLTAATLVGLTMFTIGCGDSSKANVRVVHTSPDAPNVDVVIDGKTVLTNVPYETGSNYLKVDTGSRHIQVRPTGTTTNVIDTTLSVSANDYYTVLAVGRVSDSSLTALALTDDNAAPASGDFKLRLVHASPSAGPVDIYIGAPGSGVGGTPTLTNVPFQAASKYFSEPAGSYEVYITPTGSKTVAIDTGSLSFAAGQIRTAVALDASGGGTPLTAVVLKDVN